jgi:hypothetical protein
LLNFNQRCDIHPEINEIGMIIGFGYWHAMPPKSHNPRSIPMTVSDRDSMLMDGVMRVPVVMSRLPMIVKMFMNKVYFEQ